MDNIFELLPFILIILWSIFGASGAKRKQEEQKREQEQKRAREGQRPRVETRGGVRTDRPRDAQAPVGTSRTESRPSDSAADMVPDDLWAILTGGAPAPTRPQPAPQSPEPTSYEDEYEEEDAEAPPPGGWVTSPPWDEEAAADSIEGVSAESYESYDSAAVLGYDEAADASARERYEDVRAWSWDQAPARPIESDIRSDRRHVAFHSRLAEREIGAAMETLRGPRLRTRLGLNDRGDMRRAIVLAEVLGPPKSLQQNPGSSATRRDG